MATTDPWRIAADPPYQPILERTVLPTLFKGRGLRVEIAETHAQPDVALVDDSDMPRRLVDRAQSLKGLAARISACGSFGLAIRDAAASAYGVRYSLADREPRNIPEDYRVLQSSEASLVALSPRALEPLDESELGFLWLVNRAIMSRWPLTDLDLGEDHVVVKNGRAELVSKGGGGLRVRVKRADRGAKSARGDYAGEGSSVEFELSATNRGERGVKDLRAFMVGAPAEGFRNRHIQSKLDRGNTSSLASYVFGSLMPGDSVTRRIVVDPDKGADFWIAWSPRMSLIQRAPGFGGDGSTGCTTEDPPEPIPDPFPDNVIFMVAAGGCRDVGCKLIGCPPYECRTTDDEPCGCFQS